MTHHFKFHGHKAIPSKCEIRKFEVDPKNNSDFEVSNKIWNLMDGDFILSS